MPTSSDSHDRLTVLKRFGTDPGSLRASTYIPESFPKDGPLVVVLHGSTQSAESYNNGSGWSTLADECGVALLFPGQKWANNAVGCFNWFERGDPQRGHTDAGDLSHEGIWRPLSPCRRLLRSGLELGFPRHPVKQQGEFTPDLIRIKVSVASLLSN